MDCQMFCFQCEETAGGKGCTKVGVCGKDAELAGMQDLLIYQLKGIGYFGKRVIEKGVKIESDIHQFVIDGLFSTLTNVNFDSQRFQSYVKEAQRIKEQMEGSIGVLNEVAPKAAMYVVSAAFEEMAKDAKKIGVMSDENLNEDIRSLREIILYGLKGLAAYAHHAAILGYFDDEVNQFFYKALAATIDDRLTVSDLFEISLELGKVNLKCMELLDKANTTTYGHPVPTEVSITKKKGPFIIISGHDLKDLKDLLEQTEGKGINIYTHGEMLPAHGYPELNKYEHLVGNYGGAWYEQKREFDSIPGCILMTTNCLQRPKESYNDRIFTTGVVGENEIYYIKEEKGKKDFSPIINKALELGGWTEDEEEKKILVGFGHNTVLGVADKVIEGVKNKAIRHFFLIGGCDGAKNGRSYYKEFAEKTPQDTVILTLACGKYRFNKKDYGTIDGIPRLLDIGQCNDAYSAIKIASTLAEAFGCGVNDLPLSMILSWYEQKAVCILLTLLSLNIQNIRIGPSLPAFISPNVLNILVEKYNIMPITTPDEDLKAILG